MFQNLVEYNIKGEMANTGRGITPKQARETPSDKKFTFKKPVTRPFASEISDETPLISTDKFGHFSRENPFKSNCSSSFESNLDDYCEDRNIGSTKPGTSSRSLLPEHESVNVHVTKQNKCLLSNTNQNSHRGSSRDWHLPHKVSDYRKETPIIFATSKRKADKVAEKKQVVGRNYGNCEQEITNPVNSSYFSKSSNVGKNQNKHQRTASSSVSGSLSDSSVTDGSFPMETEGDISVEDVRQLRTTDRPADFSLSADNQVQCS